MNYSDETEKYISIWDINMDAYESVMDKEPQSDYDIIYWARATLEQLVETRQLTAYQYNMRLKQLQK